jgi:hypothetical protein
VAGGITLTGIGVAALLIGAFYRSLREVPSRDPGDPSLSQLQRFGAARHRAAVRLWRPLVWIGLALIVAGLVVMVVADLLA